MNGSVIECELSSVHKRKVDGAFVLSKSSAEVVCRHYTSLIRRLWLFRNGYRSCWCESNSIYKIGNTKQYERIRLIKDIKFRKGVSIIIK